MWRRWATWNREGSAGSRRSSNSPSRTATSKAGTGGGGGRLQEVELEQAGEELVDDPGSVEVVLRRRELDLGQVHDGAADGQGELGEGRRLLALVGVGVGGQALHVVSRCPTSPMSRLASPMSSTPAEGPTREPRSFRGPSGTLADLAGRGEHGRDPGEQRALNAHGSLRLIPPSRGADEVLAVGYLPAPAVEVERPRHPDRADLRRAEVERDAERGQVLARGDQDRPRRRGTRG